jgi:DNA-binding IclR family transcriptional regulator
MEVIMNSALSRERHAVLQSLVATIGETCNLTALAGSDVVYLDRVETSWQLKMSFAAGSHVPLHATSSGKLLLSLLPRTQRERMLALLPLQGYTPHTIIDREALRSELAETRRRRIGINRAEHVRGLIGVAVPVMLGPQRACAAIALQAPEGRMTLDEMLAFTPLLQDAAHTIAATFVH